MKNFIVMTLVAISLTACSSTPDPAKVCTANWIEKRSAKAVDNIFDDTEKTVRSLRKVGNAYLDGKSPNIFQLFSLARRVQSLEKELLRGSGIKDLKTVARLCNNPQVVKDGISAYVDRMELPDKMRSFMEALPEYRNIVEGHIRDVTK